MFIWKKSLTIIIIKLSILFMLLMVNACSLKAINKQSIKLENLAQVSGSVILKEQTKHPIIVAAITYNKDKITIVKQSHADKMGTYNMYLLPGEYLIGAYIDKNNNNVRDSNEDTAMFNQGVGRFSTITLSDKQNLKLDIITIDPKNTITPYKAVHYHTNKINENTGRVISLDDAMFTKKNSDMGLWRPFDFLKQVGGGLMFLQPFAEDKTPVLFIHGLSGNPTEFKHIIKQLDQNKFQPWILYYPSGLPLNLVSDYMAKSLTTLQKKHGFSNIQLISHSMGGLISRDFLKLQQTKKLPFDTSLYVSINSPMHGLDSAARGVKESPIVIASWRDVATNSDYVKALHQWTIPKSIPYHLFFSYLPGEDGDGNVPMHSQLSLSLQNEANRIYATQGSHTGVLQDKIFIHRLIKVILAPEE